MPASHTTHDGHKSASHVDDSAKQTRLSDEQYLKRHHDRLSRTAQRAKWISRVDEHEDHAGQSLVTRSHDVIRHWAEERNAVPSTVDGTGRGRLSGILRFDFPGYGGQRLEEIDWDQFFKTFDERDLVFIYQERMRAGNQSNFFHFDRPEDERTEGAQESHSARSHKTTKDEGKEKRAAHGRTSHEGEARR